MEAFSVRLACAPCRATKILMVLIVGLTSFQTRAISQEALGPVSDTVGTAADDAASDALRGPFQPDSLQSGPPPAEQREELESARIIARVGDDVILAGDLLGQVNQFLHQRIQQIPAEQRAGLTPEVLNEQRWKLIEQLLPQSIQGKLMYLDFQRSMPKERLPEIQDSLFQAFDEKQLPVLIERAKLKSAADLDQMLRSFGSSLNQQRLTFAEQLAAAQWREKNATDSREISHEDLLQYYREHADDYHVATRAKWEQLTALNSETGSKEASYRYLGKLGNEVWQGASFAAVAKRSSHGPTASIGGQYGWTTPGSLRSKELEKAVFSLPVGKLSQRIEDADGYHIIRVIEREEEHYVPFAEVQESIREKIKEERSAAALEKYVAQLQEDFPVWSIFDEESQPRVARRNP